MAKDAPPPQFTLEDVEMILEKEPTDPSTLQWQPLLGIKKNTLRLRLNITKDNASKELLGVYLNYAYPKEDPAEMKALLAAFEQACSVAGFSSMINRQTEKAIFGPVVFFEPYTFDLPFKYAKLKLTIPPGEFQFILLKAKKEEKKNPTQFIAFKEALLREVKVWLTEWNMGTG